MHGEEADIAIISLVRSSNSRDIGFLKTPNRVNVLLSRAKHAMFLLGNREALTRDARHPFWSHIFAMLGRSAAVGSQFELRCERHPEFAAAASLPAHFTQRACARCQQRR